MVAEKDFRIRSRVTIGQLAELEAIVRWHAVESVGSALFQYGGLRLRSVGGIAGHATFSITGFHDGAELVASNTHLRELAGGDGPIPLEFAETGGGDSVMVLPDGSVGVLDMESGVYESLAASIPEFVGMLVLPDVTDEVHDGSGRGWVNPRYADQLDELRRLSKFEP